MSWSTLSLLASQPAADERSFWMPQEAARTAERVDSVFYFVYYLSVFFFVVVVSLTVYFAVKYRRRGDDDHTSPVKGNTRLEIVWAVIPALLLLVIFLWGFRSWMDTNVPPDDAYQIRVTGQKWSWSFDYPDCSGVTELVVPVDQPVKLTMSSRDVIHSFFIPAFRLKRDVLPNRYSVMWFEATKLGTFDIFCAEYCGRQHSQMLSRVKVVSAAEFQTWLNAGCGVGNLSPRELGEKLFKARCATCHSPTADRQGLAGPPFGGIYGSLENTDVGQIKVDDNYLRESITDPMAKKVVGYAPVMPTFKGLLDDKQLNGLIDYIKSLKK